MRGRSEIVGLQDALDPPSGNPGFGVVQTSALRSLVQRPEAGGIEPVSNDYLEHPCRNDRPVNRLVFNAG